MTETMEIQRMPDAMEALAKWYMKKEQQEKENPKEDRWTGCCYEKDLDDHIGTYNA